MSEPRSLSHVAGAGVAEHNVPRSIRILKMLFAVAEFFFLLFAWVVLNGWQWISHGITSEAALWAASGVTIAVGLTWASLSVLNKILSVRKNEMGQHVISRSGESWRVSVACLLVFGFVAGAGVFFKMADDSKPLPKKLAREEIKVSPPNPQQEGLIPIYFWDYATWINPAWFEQVNIMLPYEKGPPQKLLSKVYFENPKTHSIELELHGKRPRSYASEDVNTIFSESILHPRDWPLLFKLQREAGLETTGAQTLYLTRLNQGTPNITQAIGIPWTQTSERGAGRMFYWGPDGSVFQTKCEAPCKMARMLELVQFPQDPKGSQHERLEWTAGYLRKLLMSQPIDRSQSEAALARRENILSIYLLSLLTQDPRDPEAFFHLGKLAKNKETALSAMRYGRDLGLEAAKIAELEAVASRLEGAGR